MVTVKCIATGFPSSVAGWYFHWRSASMAAWWRTVGPETTFIEETRPFVPIRASTRTSPEMCWVLAITGYIGGTEEIRCAVTTLPPTGRTGAGAAGWLALPPRRPPLKGESPEEGCY